MCDEIRSVYTQCAIKFVPCMLSMDIHVKTVHVVCWLSMHKNSFLVCSVCDEIVSLYAQCAIKSSTCMRAIIFENYNNQNFEKLSRIPSSKSKVKILGEKNLL